MTPLPILLAAIFLGTGNCSYKMVASMFGKCESVIGIFWDEVFILRNKVKQEKLVVWPLSNRELVSHFFIFRPNADAILTKV